MLKFQYFGHLVQSADSLEDSDAEIEGKRRREDERLDGIPDSMDMNLSKLWEIVKDWEVWHKAVHGVAKSQTRLRD